MMTTEVGSPSADGREGEAAPGKHGAKPVHRHVYYRLYTKEDALESRNPIYSNDRSISRVLTRSVAPPHTGALLKRHLCRTEGFEELGNNNLYPSLTATTTLEDSARVSLRGNAGPGSSESEPMALVVDISAVEKRLGPSTVDPQTLLERHEEPRYVFYRLYEKGGEVASKTSFNENDSSLGRIEAVSIPPPHTVSSLKTRLVKVEGVSSQDVQLFEDEYGETDMKDDDAIALYSVDYPGSTKDEPIAIVYESQKTSSASNLQDSVPPHDSAFTKQIKSNLKFDWPSPDPAWLSYSVDEILKTDGILRTEKWNNGSTIYEHTCYLAMNSAGKKAFIHSTHVAFC